MLPHWKEYTITVPGKRGEFSVHYTRTGEGSGKPPMVLVHGFSDNGLCWLPVARAMEDEWDVILPDARGHGQSQRLRVGEQVHMADDLADLLRALGVDKPVIAGHSMGGSTAGLLDARYPGLARALILEDPGLRPHTPVPAESKERQEHPFKKWIMGLRGKTVEQVIIGGRQNDPHWPKDEWPAWAESKLQVDPNIFEVEMVWPDWREVVRGISAPTLLITGDVEKGGIISAEVAQAFTAMNPNVRVVHIPRSGHSIRRDKPAEYLRAIRDFLDEVK